VIRAAAAHPAAAHPAAAHPSGSSAAKPTGDAAAEPTGDAAAEPTGDAAAEPTGDAAAEPTGDAAAEPTGDAAEPSRESAATGATGTTRPCAVTPSSERRWRTRLPHRTLRARAAKLKVARGACPLAGGGWRGPAPAAECAAAESTAAESAARPKREAAHVSARTARGVSARESRASLALAHRRARRRGTAATHPNTAGRSQLRAADLRRRLTRGTATGDAAPARPHATARRGPRAAAG
jgi:hypothetical protein